ncbi:MAG: hypothetical protein ACRYGM_08250, partial [Janthinobacterium lividum]
ALTGIVLGIVLMVAGVSTVLTARERWGVLGTICILVGALMLGPAIILISQGTRTLADANGITSPIVALPLAFLFVALLFAGSAILARSGLLAALTVLMLAAASGSSSFYGHATYTLSVTQPLVTVVLFSALGFAAYRLSLLLSGDWEHLAISVARTSVFLVNLGFWIGSLWGDDRPWITLPTPVTVPPDAFSIVWAVALLVIAIWAGRVNRRWVLNLAAVFGGIHFYTQWFDHFGADAIGVLGGGLLMLVFAVVLWTVNQRVAGAR